MNPQNDPKIPKEIFPSLTHLLNLEGFFDTVTDTPSMDKKPRKAVEQIRIYQDSLTAPTIRRLFIYSPRNSTSSSWFYTDLTLSPL